MAKVKWDGGAELASALDEWEEDESRSYTPYAGPEPKKGMYRFQVKRIKKDVSKNGFPQLVVDLEMSPTLPAHKQYAGFFTRQFVVVKKDGSTAFRVKPLLTALGVTGKQFVTATIVDDEGYVLKIGGKAIPGAIVMANIYKPAGDEYFKANFHAVPEEADGADDDSDDDDSGDDEAPF